MILDCDPGHDDAIAIVVAARHAELLGITTVAGNAPLERTTHNARVVRHLLDVDVEIHPGAARPLLEEARAAPAVHGASGLDGADLPTPTRPLDGRDAVRFIVDTCRARPGTWLVGVGPLTNLALALRAAPDLTDHLGGISIMGGGTIGNRTPVAEFNIWADPEAAAIVFNADVPRLMAGLDVTLQLLATPDRIDELARLGGPLATTLAELLRFFTGTYANRYEDLPGAAVHDPCAVLALTHSQLFTRRRRHVAVETSGALTRGMTVIDRRTLLERLEPNTDVLEGIDADAAWQIIVDAVAHSASYGEHP